MSEPRHPSCDSGEPINLFALVAYIPGPLGEFLDELRRELEPNSVAPRAHVTLLPPRPFREDVRIAEADRYLERALGEIAPLEIYLGGVEMFPVTNVVYVAVDGGFMQMRHLHDRLNAGPVCHLEPFHYHPHVTIVQGLPADEAAEKAVKAAERWAAYRGPRGFAAESFCFVRNTTVNRWLDLAEYSMVPAIR